MPKCAKAPVWGYTGAAIIKSSTLLRSRQFCGIYKDFLLYKTNWRDCARYAGSTLGWARIMIRIEVTLQFGNAALLDYCHAKKEKGEGRLMRSGYRIVTVVPESKSQTL